MKNTNTLHEKLSSIVQHMKIILDQLYYGHLVILYKIPTFDFKKRNNQLNFIMLTLQVKEANLLILNQLYVMAVMHNKPID